MQVGRFRAAIGVFRGAPTAGAPREKGGVDMSRRLLARIGVALVIAGMLSGCALAVRRPSVAELKYNPARYHDRTVAIDGVVTSSWGVPLVPFRMYKVDDGTGEVTVVANSGRVPARVRGCGSRGA
jgi:hypothetical protein